MARKHVLIVGAGAIGSYYGGRLQQAGARVSVVCRSDYDVVRSNGLRIESTDGDFHFAPDAVVHSVEEAPGAVDYLIVTTKVLPEIDVAALIRPAVSPNTTLVLLQNGINIEVPVQEAYPEHLLISALAFICVSRTAPGHVIHQDFGRLVLGRYPAGDAPEVDALAGLFQTANINCTVDSDVVRARYAKLLWNAPFNPISVLGGQLSTREMLTSPPCRELVQAVMNEVIALSCAAGHPLDPALIEKNMTDTERMTPYKTSMLLDFENGRPLEVDAILGNALALAEKLGVATPRMKTLHALLAAVDAHLRASRC